MLAQDRLRRHVLGIPQPLAPREPSRGPIVTLLACDIFPLLLTRQCALAASEA